MGFRPEEKGIKTPYLIWVSSLFWMGFRPEEKGIKTRNQPPLSSACLLMGFRPEEKGIKT
ncbi:protein of unknown function [Candidatus Nitrospira inopinata]|uniref:Uncharacterized protein n=1 Tax=Candidatus Nitrospira inopinata TaxID=1715989 RepID=A0A0S4KS66_9BACT|nr:protein of unknown function [Candidatus Nitrospira inopinata]